MLTLHFLELAVVACEQGEDPLRLSVTVDVQLEVGQHGAVEESQQAFGDSSMHVRICLSPMHNSIQHSFMGEPPKSSLA